MRAELLTIGAELMSGSTVNTNAAELARRLSDIGISCQRHVTVGDDRQSLIAMLRESLSRCDLLVITGGLGPTFDDVTMEVLARVTNRPLRFHASIARAIRRFYTRRHRRLQRAALRQAWLPKDGRPLPNPLGTAPGLWLKTPQTLIIALPGVPREMRAIAERSVLPPLKRLSGGRVVEGVTLRTAGLVELSIEALLQHLTIPSNVQIGLYPHLRMVDVRITAVASSRAAALRARSRVERPLRRALGHHLYGTNEETLEAVIGRLLMARHRTVAVAESCTGGLVCDRLTNVSGSSRYLIAGLVAYHNDIKRDQLGVSQHLLARHGAVSAPVAGGMAQGIRRLARTDLGVAITGIAGPTGGTTRKPVGLVYLAIATPHHTFTRRCQFFGDRLSIKAQAAQTALDWLRRYLGSDPNRETR